MTVKKILLGTDFSGEAGVALEHALRIACHTGAELVVAHAGAALDPADEALATETAALAEYRRILAETEAVSRGHLDEIVRRARAAGIEATELVVDGAAAGALCEAAERIDADLVVVGTRGHTGFARSLLGSVAERIVRLSSRHVLVARAVPGWQIPTGSAAPAPATSDWGYPRVLVPTDFSPRAEAALEAALELVAPGGELELLHAWQLPALTGSLVPGRLSDAALEPVRASIEAGARANGRALIARHQDRPVRFELTIVHDSPARAIASRAEEGGHHLCVMGGHGRRGIRRWILGSVAEATVRHAPCSVLVVHLPGEAPADG